jgi:hypothetical protein
MLNGARGASVMNSLLLRGARDTRARLIAAVRRARVKAPRRAAQSREMSGFSPKAAMKAVLGTGARAAWPAVESFSEMGARLSRGGVAIQWKRTWDAELDAALEQLPPPLGCTRDQYRVLTQPTGVPKRHALAREGEAVVALISLRRRKMFWEPVACQCLPGFIAPAVNGAALGRALASLGVEVRVSSGLDAIDPALKPRRTHQYDVHQIDLTGDYAAHWKKRNQKHLWAVRRARQRCENATHRVDGEGDLEWIVDQWRQNWEDDPELEAVAAIDRQRFWRALADSAPADGGWRVHTLQLLSDGQRAAGTVLLSRGDFISFQCTARDPAFETLSAGTRILDLAIEWSAQNGFKCFDLGSGDYKKRWGKVGTVRYGAVFRPRLMDALYRVDPE